jgi:hypothetical protein
MKTSEQYVEAQHKIISQAFARDSHLSSAGVSSEMRFDQLSADADKFPVEMSKIAEQYQDLTTDC